jgi:hypothetical protein
MLALKRLRAQGKTQQWTSNETNESRIRTVLGESDDLQHPSDFGKDLFQFKTKKRKWN